MKFVLLLIVAVAFVAAAPAKDDKKPLPTMAKQTPAQDRFGHGGGGFGKFFGGGEGPEVFLIPMPPPPPCGGGCGGGYGSQGGGMGGGSGGSGFGK